MSFQSKLTIAALVCGAAVSAQAADWYVGASVGASDWKSPAPPAGVTIDKRGNGYKLFGGVGFSPNFALEGGYADLGKATIAGGGVSEVIKGYGYFLDAVGKVPLSTDLSLLFRLGAFNGHAKIAGPVVNGSDSGTDIKYGVGLNYALNKTLAIRGEWERYRFKGFGEKQDVDLLSVGLTFGF